MSDTSPPDNDLRALSDTAAATEAHCRAMSALVVSRHTGVEE